jgi:hypothetical protein
LDTFKSACSDTSTKPRLDTSPMVKLNFNKRCSWKSLIAAVLLSLGCDIALHIGPMSLGEALCGTSPAIYAFRAAWRPQSMTCLRIFHDYRDVFFDFKTFKSRLYKAVTSLAPPILFLLIFFAPSPSSALATFLYTSASHLPLWSCYNTATTSLGYHPLLPSFSSTSLTRCVT